MANEEVFGARFEIDVNNLKSGITEANRYIKMSESEFKAAAAGMDDWTQSEEGLSAKLTSLDQKLSAQNAILQARKQKLDQLKSSENASASEIQNATIQLNNAQAAYNKTEKEIGQTSTALENFRSDAGQAGTAARSAGDDAETSGSKFESLGDFVKDSAGKLVAFAAAAAGISTAGDYITGASTATAKLNAALGEAANESGAFNDVLKDLYGANYGESFEDLADSASRVVQIMGNDISPESLEDVTRSAIVLRDTFDMDVNESVKAAQVMMQNFGMDSTEAFDMLAAGAQQGLNINDDMLDSFSEYSPYFAQIGLDADDMFTAFASGADISMYGVDKAGDAFKEFGIRVVDGSNTTSEAFDAMGLDMDEYAAKIMEGGDTAKGATGDIIAALLGMDDPIAQNIAGVNLFGTQWEDLGQDGANAMLSLMGTANDTAGTLGEIDSIRYDNIGDSFSAIGRAIETGLLSPLQDELEPVISDFTNAVLPAIKDGSQWFLDNLPTIGGLISMVAGGAAAFGAYSIVTTVVTALQAFKVAQEGATIAQAAFNMVMNANPIMLIVTAIGALVAGLIYLWTTNEGFRDAVIGVWETVSSTVGGVIDGLVNFFTVTVPEAIANMLTFFSELPGNILGFLTTALVNVGTWVANMATKAVEVGTQFLSNIISFFTQLPGQIFGFLTFAINHVIAWVTMMVQYAQQVGTQFLSNIISFFTQLPGQILGFLTFAINHVIAWVRMMVQYAQQAGSQFLSKIVSFITQLPGKIAGFLTTTVSKVTAFAGNFASNAASAGSRFISSIAGKVSEAPGKVADILSQIPGKVSGFAGDMVSAAGDMIGGLVRGIGDGASAVVEKIKEICSGALDAVKDFFGIHSPSRVMMEMGEYIDKGMEIGIGNGIKDVSKMAEQLSEAATPDINPSAFTMSTETGANAVGGVDVGSTLPTGAQGVSVVQNFYSPEAITAKDAYRQGVRLKQTLAAGV